MGRWCLLIVLVVACAGEDSGAGDPAFGRATVTLDGSQQPLRYAWMYPMRGAPLEMSQRNLGWTITFTETPTPFCSSNFDPPMDIRVWTAEELADGVEGTATLPADVDIHIEPGIVSFPSDLYGEGFMGVQLLYGTLRLAAFSPAAMSGTLEGSAIEDGRMPISRTLAISFDAHACP